MEMASAHGLALKLLEMNRLDRINRNEFLEIMSEEDKIIKLWTAAANNSRFQKQIFFQLTRRTLVFVFSQSSLKEVKKKELLRGVSTYFNKFSNLLRNDLDIRKSVIDVIVDPWKNTFFSWEELLQRRITVLDAKKVQEYFYHEPEEIVLARAHYFSKQGKHEAAMTLAKSSFLFYSRISNSLSHWDPLTSNPAQCKNEFRKGTASMDWYLYYLRKRNLTVICNELKQLECHEGVLLVKRLIQTSLIPFAFTIVQIFLMRELLEPSKFCCTKSLISLWCVLHKKKKSSMAVISEAIQKLMATYAPSSAHFYLLADAIWDQFGPSFTKVYVELFVRGLTVDLNHLEAARNGDRHEDAIYLKRQISSMFCKLSTLFAEFHGRAARECLFSAFSLKPSKKKLNKLQTMTFGAKAAVKKKITTDSVFVKNCKCTVECNGLCASKDSLDHPLLTKGIRDVPYSVVQDLVSLLEGVRSISFQYNLFEWQSNFYELHDYLKCSADSEICKNWDSETECASDDDDPSDSEATVCQTREMDTEPIHYPVKRKSESDDMKMMFSLDVGANIEVGGEEHNKRMKLEDQNRNAVSALDMSSTHVKSLQNFSTARRVEDAIENVIRMQLDNNRQKSDISLDNSQGSLINTSLNHINDGTEKLSLSSVYKSGSENQIYPYSLTNYAKQKNLSSDFKDIYVPIHSSSSKFGMEDAIKIASTSHSSPSVSSKCATSQTFDHQKKINTIQQQSYKHVVESKFPINTGNIPCYNRSKNISVSTADTEKKVPVYQQEALNLESKSTIYQQIRNVSSTISQSSKFITNQTTMQVLNKSDISTSDFSRPQFSSNPFVGSSDTVTSPLNLVQSQQSTRYPPVSHHVSKSSSVFKADSRYQIVDNMSIVKRVNKSVSCFQNNQLVHCDRSSVIQHTMQHVRDNNTQIHASEVSIPNQLAVSVNSDAAEQIRSVPKKNVTNLPPFTVNVTDRSIPNSLAVSANLVIARKPQPQIEVSSPQPATSNLTTVRSTDTITIPGILASPSVIVSPWEAQRKVHGELLYKKNANAITSSTIDKRIYKNRLPYGRQIVFKPEPKVIQQSVTDSKNNVTQAIISPSHISSTYYAIPSISQSNTSTSQNWAVVNKSSSSSSSSHAVSESASSPLWYSEPFPKSYNNGDKISSKANESLVVKAEKNISQPAKHTSNIKPFILCSKQINPYTNNNKMIIPAMPTTVSHPLNNPISGSSAMSSVLNTDTYSLPNPAPAVTNSSILLKDYISSSPSNFHLNNMTNVKIYSNLQNSMKRNFQELSSELSDPSQLCTAITQNEKHAGLSIPDVTDTHVTQISPSAFSKSCCSPSEVNPCQNCSTSGDILVQPSSEKNSDVHPVHTYASSKEMANILYVSSLNRWIHRS